MTKLGKYLKPFALSILAIVALLFTQAMCELAMPDYMSSIVAVSYTHLAFSIIYAVSMKG